MNTQIQLHRFGSLGTLIALFAVAAGAHATTNIWSGGATMDNTWTNSHNWVGSVAPVPGDDLQFPDGASKSNNNDDYTNGTTFNSISFFHSGNSRLGRTYTLAGNSIALNAGVSAANNNGILWPNAVGNALMLNSNQTFSTTPFTSLSFQGGINLNGKDLTFDTAQGWPIDVHAVISGSGGLIKTNGGTLTLYTNNTYTGSTIIAGGTLALSTQGKIPNSTNIVVSGASAIFSVGGGFTLNSGQTLSGIGSVSGDVTADFGGVISPGTNGVGTLTFNNNLTLNPAATLAVDLNGTNAGTSYNQVSVQGTVAPNNGTLAVTLGYTPALGDSFVIINNAGANAVIGTFSGLPEGAFFTNSGVSFRISYAGGGGNDVVLTRANLPATFIVTNMADNGAGSLRAALAAAANGDIIVFASNVTGTITLTSGELLVNQGVNILGPGPAILAVNGNYVSRVFHITNGVAAFISGLTMTNGAVGGSAPGSIGAGIWNDHSMLTLSNCTVTYSQNVVGNGSGIYNDGSFGSATLSILASTISYNNAAADGGGIFNDGEFGSATVSIIASTIYHNGAFTTTGGGGGVANYALNGHATLLVTNSTFAYNSSQDLGGGIYNLGNSGTGVVAVIASTFNGNAGVNYGGGSIYNQGPGATLKIGGTILNTAVFKENIVNGGTVVSDGYNLSSDNASGVLTNPTDQLNTNPMLGPLADNGGPTLTCALLWGSPAIDKGKSFGLTTDQRGQRRSYDFPSITNASGGDGSDIGAFELNPAARFISIAALASSIQLQGAGISNFTYTIQAATNLNPVITWTNLGTSLANSNGIFSFAGTNAPQFPRRFYRAVSP